MAHFERSAAAALAIVLFGACAPTPDTAEPGRVPAAQGFSAAGIGELNNGLRQLVDQRRIAGAVTMLSRHGEIVQFEAFGQRDIESAMPMERDTIFRIYSMTKPVTGVAMMILREQGLWDLDDPVAKLVPEFRNLTVAVEDADGNVRTVPPEHAMTMRELMTHTGGLTYGFFSQSAVDTMYQRANVLDPSSSLQTMIDKLAGLPLRQQPGSLWHYSVSVDVQGYIVEKLSGQSLPEFMAERIFEPLDMVDTAFFVPADKTARFAPTVYDYGPNRELLRSGSGGLDLVGDYSRPPALASGGGGLVSTARDYMRFAQMLLNDGELDGVRILSADSVSVMRRNHAATTKADGAVQLGPGTGFGLDVAVLLDPSAEQSPLGRGSYWWAGAAGTWFWIDPENDLAFVGMAQHDYFDIADIVASTQQWTYRALTDPGP